MHKPDRWNRLLDIAQANLMKVAKKITFTENRCRDEQQKIIKIEEMRRYYMDQLVSSAAKEGAALNHWLLTLNLLSEQVAHCKENAEKLELEMYALSKQRAAFLRAKEKYDLLIKRATFKLQKDKSREEQSKVDDHARALWVSQRG